MKTQGSVLLWESASVLLCTGAGQGEQKQTPHAGLPRFSDN